MTEDSGWITAIAGLSLDRIGRIQFGNALSAEDFGRLLQSIRRHVGEFALFDPLFPSVSDPGAYFSYCALPPLPKRWHMTLGNHGWSGGIYQIEEQTILCQLENLWRQGKLNSVSIDHVNFFHHRPRQSGEANNTMNARLMQIHKTVANDGPHAERL